MNQALTFPGRFVWLATVVTGTLCFGQQQTIQVPGIAQIALAGA